MRPLETRLETPLIDNSDDLVEAGPPVKVVLLGDSGVGKSSILQGGFQKAPAPTVGASFVSCGVIVEKRRKIRLHVWDNAGQERFQGMLPMYLRNAAAAIIVFDLTDRKSFDSVQRWHRELIAACRKQDPVVVLIGNKADLRCRRKVSESEALKIAVSLEVTYFEMCACDTKFDDVLRGIASSAPRNNNQLQQSAANIACKHQCKQTGCCHLH